MCRIRSLLGALALILAGSCIAATTYTYDSLSRLTGVDYGNGSTISYTYDAAGNRLSQIIQSSSALGQPSIVSVVASNGQVLVTFAPPGSDGGSAITGYVATASPGGQIGSCVAPCTTITVTGLSNGTAYTFTVTATNGLGSSATSTASATVYPVNRLYTASSPVLPSAGTIVALLSGGGAGCSFDGTQYLPRTGHLRSPPTDSGPAYMEFWHGLFDFSTVGCTPGGALTLTLTYPAPLPTGMQYWSYGPTSGTVTPHWYTLPAQLTGNQATLALTEGSAGDDDRTANGVLLSRGGLGIAPWDVFWRKGDGTNAVWQFTGPGPMQFASAFPPGVPTSWQAKGTGDVNGDGVPDVVWFDPSLGRVAIWLMSSPAAIGGATFPASVGAGSPWVLSGVGDVNGDGRADLLWRNSGTGELLVWQMSAAGSIASAQSHGVVPLSYALRGVGDVNGDGVDDLVWFQASDGQVALWLMADDGTHTAAFPGAVGAGSWRPYKVGDFDGDGKADIFWRNEANGMTAAWYLNGGVLADFDFFVSVPLAEWQLGTIGDFDLDGRSDLMWYAPGSGSVVRWLMKGRHVAPTVENLPGVGTGWQMVQ